MLSYGMPYDLFWKGSPSAIYYYVDKAEREQEEKVNMINQQCYMQGQYVYKALCCVAPILVAFPKKNAKPEPYPDKPIELKKPLTAEQEKQKEEYMQYVSMKKLEQYSKQKEVTDYGE